MDGAALNDHATHVAGTVIASGVSANAKGMAPAGNVDSYDWNSDITEMTLRGAAAPDEAGKIFLSNHSYGYVSGWNYVNGGSPFRVWEWNGDGTTVSGTEQDFGRYNSFARDTDSLASAARGTIGITIRRTASRWPFRQATPPSLPMTAPAIPAATALTGAGLKT
jgi:hypothetical protein